MTSEGNVAYKQMVHGLITDSSVLILRFYLGNLNSEPLITSTSWIYLQKDELNQYSSIAYPVPGTVLSAEDIIRAVEVEILSVLYLQPRPGEEYYTI